MLGEGGHRSVPQGIKPAPEARREVSPARKRWVKRKEDQSAVGAADHPKMYRGSYSMPAFFSIEMNSSSNVLCDGAVPDFECSARRPQCSTCLPRSRRIPFA